MDYVMRRPVGTPQADAQFREYIGYGKASLPVKYGGRVYQMCRIESGYLFVRVDGYGPDDLDFLPGSSGVTESLAEGRRSFRVGRDEVGGITVTGRYSDYFILGSVIIKLNVVQGGKKREYGLSLFGDVNEFVLRSFFDGIRTEIVADKGLPPAPALAKASVIMHFNRRCRMLDAIMTVTAIVSALLLGVDLFFDTPVNNLLTGIGALLPLVNYFIYISRQELVSFIAPSVPKNMRGISRRYVGFYARFAVPSCVGMMSAVMGRSADTDLLRLFLMGTGVFAVMITLMLIFCREYRYRYILMVGYAVLMLIYPGMAVHFVNRMAPVSDIRSYTATVEKYRVNPDSDTDTAEYIGVTLSDGEQYEVPLGISQHTGVKPGETVVSVKEYRGLLGIGCADLRACSESRRVRMAQLNFVQLADIFAR